MPRRNESLDLPAYVTGRVPGRIQRLSWDERRSLIAENLLPWLRADSHRHVDLELRSIRVRSTATRPNDWAKHNWRDAPLHLDTYYQSPGAREASVTYLELDHWLGAAASCDAGGIGGLLQSLKTANAPQRIFDDILTLEAIYSLSGYSPESPCRTIPVPKQEDRASFDEITGQLSQWQVLSPVATRFAFAASSPTAAMQIAVNGEHGVYHGSLNGGAIRLHPSLYYFLIASEIERHHPDFNRLACPPLEYSRHPNLTWAQRTIASLYEHKGFNEDKYWLRWLNAVCASAAVYEPGAIPNFMLAQSPRTGERLLAENAKLRLSGASIAESDVSFDI